MAREKSIKTSKSRDVGSVFKVYKGFVVVLREGCKGFGD